MVYARCFNCNVGLPVCQKSMLELIEAGLPVFCCTDCSLEFPDNRTKEFENRMNNLKIKFSE